MNEKNRVEPLERIQDCIDRIPFLTRFIRHRNNKDGFFSFDSEEIDAYMGFRLVAPQGIILASDLNRLLEEAERRGDLK